MKTRASTQFSNDDSLYARRNFLLYIHRARLKRNEKINMIEMFEEVSTPRA